MTEDFLHYIWRTKQFDNQNLTSKNKEGIKLLHFGNYNEDAGPDFLDGRVMINDKLWAGQIEFHLKSTDWYKHKHESDLAYDNVILHVVYEDNGVVLRKDGSEIPCLELKGRFDEHLYWRYEQLMQGKRFIPCENQLENVDDFEKMEQYDKWLVERLQRKSAWMLSVYQSENHDWDTVFYRALMYAFGLRVNAEPFLGLAIKLPLKVLEKHKSSLTQIEALLFGVAGFLDQDLNDEYCKELKQEFDFLKLKYKLTSLEKVEWKFSKMRPQGFPTIRIAQVAAFIYGQFPSFENAIKSGDLDEVYNFLEAETSPYWQSHFVLEKESAVQVKHPGKDFLKRIVINAIVPLHFAYAEITQESFYRQRALDILDQLPKEVNKVTNKLEKLGFSNSNGYESQALLEMYNNYCSDKKCLNCGIANRLLQH